jgi:hypothetical protein
MQLDAEMAEPEGGVERSVAPVGQNGGDRLAEKGRRPGVPGRAASEEAEQPLAAGDVQDVADAHPPESA